MTQSLEVMKRKARDKFWLSPNMAFQKQGFFDSQIEDVNKDLDTLIELVYNARTQEVVGIAEGMKIKDIVPRRELLPNDLYPIALKNNYNKALTDLIATLTKISNN